MAQDASTDPRPPEEDTSISSDTGQRRWLTPGRLFLLGLLVAAVAGFFLLGLHRYVTLETIKENRDRLKDWVQSRYLLSVALFFAVYVAVSGLSIPWGATALTLLAGFLFERWLGTAIVSFASTAGATLAFLSSRYLFRDLARRRLGKWYEQIERGLEADGPYYLLMLRLIFVVPFVAINLAMGLTRTRVWTFWWVSQLGMLPATFLYTNAGTELGKIDEPGDILSPSLIMSLALLGLVPLVLRRAWKWWRGRARQPE